MTIAFLIAAAVAIVSTVFVVTRMAAVHALLYLIVSLLATAVMFLTLGAPFLAALQLVVYAGAVMVLFVFAAVMLDLGPRSAEQERVWFVPSVWAGPAVLATVLALLLMWVVIGPRTGTTSVHYVGPVAVSESMLTTYLIGVELASVLLMASLVAAYHLGRREHIDTSRIESRPSGGAG